MEDVLAVYQRPRDADFPLLCFDEASKQLIADTREPIPMKPGQPGRVDYEYERQGTASLFMFFAPLEGWRHIKVNRRTAVDYAHDLKDLADRHFPKARKIILVQDNLWTPPAQGNSVSAGGVECTNLSGLLRDCSCPWP